MELQVRDSKSRNRLVEVLSLNGYKLQTEVVYNPFPQNEMIDHFKVNVDGDGNG